MSLEWQRSQSLETIAIAIPLQRNPCILFLFTAILAVFRSRLQLLVNLHQVVVTAMSLKDAIGKAFMGRLGSIPYRQSTLGCSQTVHARCYVRNSELDYLFLCFLSEDCLKQQCPRCDLLRPSSQIPFTQPSLSTSCRPLSTSTSCESGCRMMGA